MDSGTTGATGGPPPPLPPKKQRDTLNKPPPPTPPRGVQAPVLGVHSMNISDRRSKSNLVTVELIASSTITIQVDRGTSLQCLCDVVASNSDFKLKPGAFEIWHKGKGGKKMCIKNEEKMQKLWNDTKDEDFLSLMCNAK